MLLYARLWHGVDPLLPIVFSLVLRLTLEVTPRMIRAIECVPVCN